MMKALLLGAGLVFAAGLALPASAADTMMKGKTHKMSGKHMKHMKSCYDYAWESQDQKDCLAKHGGMDMTDDTGKKKSSKKTM